MDFSEKEGVPILLWKTFYMRIKLEREKVKKVSIKFFHHYFLTHYIPKQKDNVGGKDEEGEPD